MALKITVKKESNEFNQLFKNYCKYDTDRYHYLDTNSYQYELFNYIFMECLIDDYNHWNSKKMSDLKDIADFNIESVKEEFKACGFNLKSKRDIIIWIMRIPSSINLENKNYYLYDTELTGMIEDDAVSEEDLQEKFYDIYVYPTYRKYVNLMKNLKPFLRQIKDNTIICKNEEIFTIILLAKNDMRIDYYAMKNILSYL